MSEEWKNENDAENERPDYEEDYEAPEEERSTLTQTAGTGKRTSRTIGVLLIAAAVIALIALMTGTNGGGSGEDEAAAVTSESAYPTAEVTKKPEEVTSGSVEAVSSSSEAGENVSSSSEAVSSSSAMTPEEKQQAEAQARHPYINPDGSINDEKLKEMGLYDEFYGISSSSSSAAGTTGDAYDPENNTDDMNAAHDQYLLNVQQMQSEINSGQVSVTTKNGDDFSNYGISDVAAFAFDVSLANRSARMTTADPKYIEVVNEDGTNYVDVYVDEFSLLRFTYTENPSYDKTYDVTNVQLPVEKLNEIDQDHYNRMKQQ